MRRRLLAAFALVAVSRAAASEIVSERPDAVAVTLYHVVQQDTSDMMGGYSPREKFGFVTETRERDASSLPLRETVETRVHERQHGGAVEHIALVPMRRARAEQRGETQILRDRQFSVEAVGMAEPG